MTEPTFFSELVSRLKQAQFSGVTLLHWKQGEPKLIEFPGQRIPLAYHDSSVDSKEPVRAK